MCRRKFIQSKVFYCHELEYVRADKRNNIVGETVRDVYDWLLQENVGAVVIENIQLRQQHDTDKRFNRLTHNFKKKKLTEMIVRRAYGLGFASKKRIRRIPVLSVVSSIGKSMGYPSMKAPLW